MYMYRNFYYGNICLCTETLVTETSVYVRRLFVTETSVYVHVQKLLLRKQVFMYRDPCYGHKRLCTETVVTETSVNVQRPLLRKQVFMYRDPCYGNKCLCTETLVTATSVYVQGVAHAGQHLLITQALIHTHLTQNKYWSIDWHIKIATMVIPENYKWNKFKQQYNCYWHAFSLSNLSTVKILASGKTLNSVALFM